MLVLTRRPLETIVIGGTIRVTVLAIKGHQVRLGWDAPGDVKIVREELRRRAAEGAEGAASTPAAHVPEG